MPTDQVAYPNTRRVGLAESSRLLLFHLLQQEYGQDHHSTAELEHIESERRHLRERVSRKPGTVFVLERILTDLYDDARQQWQGTVAHANRLPPSCCPYTLASLLGIQGNIQCTM